MINNLGIEVPTNEIINLSDLFFIFEILNSQDLKDKIISGELIINNGEYDLNISDSLKYLNFYI
jgi:hypothetical protein